MTRMGLRSVLSRVGIDPFIAAMLCVVALASVLPARGEGAVIAGHATTAAIALLFFLHGAKLEPREALSGARHWRLHALVLAFTFVLFPVLGLALHAIAAGLLPASLWTGLMLLCVLPSTVQSSIAFTAIGGGNVPAALCSATASNLIGIVLSPLLAGLLLRTHGGISASAVSEIALQLLLPFVLGQLARRWLVSFMARHRSLLGLVDRGSILLVIYTAFSEGVVHGIWHQLALSQLAILLVVNACLLASVLVATTYASRLLGFSRRDEVAIVFCGSKKSLASGLPMATVLFGGQSLGLIVLPLMLFHQIQLMACAYLARRYASAHEPAERTVTVRA